MSYDLNMQELNGKRVFYKNKVFKVQSVLKLKDKYSILGFWEKNGSIPKNSHVVQIEVKDLSELILA